MFRELGFTASALEVARHYAGLIDGFVFDTVDAGAEPDIRDLGLATLFTDTIMGSLDDRRRLAADVRGFAAGLGKGSANQ